MATILVIENESANLVVLAMILRSLGYKVLEAASRGEAWFACSDHHGPIQLAILASDHSPEFVTRLQIVCPQLRGVLFVSEVPPMELLDIPCRYAFLPKPLRVDALAGAIKELLHGPKMRAFSSAG